jgi:hypothetical protein
LWEILYYLWRQYLGSALEHHAAAGFVYFSGW